MDSKYLVVGVFVVLIAIAALQSYQLNAMKAKIDSIQGVSTGTVAQLTSNNIPSAPAQTTALPQQVGGC